MAQERLTILSISPWPELWSMKSQAGAPDNYKVVQGFRRNGHRVIQIAPLQGNVARDEIVDGIRLIRFKHERSLITKALARVGLDDLWNWLEINWRTIRHARKLAKKVRFDAIIGHSAIVAPAAFLLGRRYRVPSVLHIYGTFLYPQLDQRDLLLKSEYWGWRVPVTRLVILDDGTQGDKVAQRLGLDPDKYVFWRNGVDAELFSADPDRAAIRDRWGIGQEQKLVLTACRLVYWKRIDRLVSAAPLIVKEQPSTVFMVLGDGPEMSSLQKQAQELGVAANFRFEGSLPNNEVMELMRAADVFASLNDLSNVGNPLLEALASGKAIVTLDTGATNTVIEDGVNGLLIAPDDTEELAAAFLRIFKSEELQQKLEAGAREYALSNIPTWEERSDREVRLVEGLL